VGKRCPRQATAANPAIIPVTASAIASHTKTQPTASHATRPTAATAASSPNPICSGCFVPDRAEFAAVRCRLLVTKLVDRLAAVPSDVARHAALVRGSLREELSDRFELARALVQTAEPLSYAIELF
jgi:hypothetical protein